MCQHRLDELRRIFLSLVCCQPPLQEFRFQLCLSPYFGPTFPRPRTQVSGRGQEYGPCLGRHQRVPCFLLDTSPSLLYSRLLRIPVLQIEYIPWLQCGLSCFRPRTYAVYAAVVGRRAGDATGWLGAARPWTPAACAAGTTAAAQGARELRTAAPRWMCAGCAAVAGWGADMAVVVWKDWSGPGLEIVVQGQQRTAGGGSTVGPCALGRRSEFCGVRGRIAPQTTLLRCAPRWWSTRTCPHVYRSARVRCRRIGPWASPGSAQTNGASWQTRRCPPPAHGSSCDTLRRARQARTGTRTGQMCRAGWM